MGIIKKIVLPGIVAVALYIYSGARFALDLVGWSTAPDDIGVAMSRADQLFAWLMSIPVWLPFIGALGFTIVMTMVYRPIVATALGQSDGPPRLAPTPEQKLISSIYVDILSTKKQVRADVMRNNSDPRFVKISVTKLSVGVSASVRSVLARIKDFNVEVPLVGINVSRSEGVMINDYFDTILPFVGGNQIEELKAESLAFIKALPTPPLPPKDSAGETRR